MPAIAPPPVRRVTIEEIRAARERIRGVITRTPLIRLRHDVAGAPEIWLKLENLQPINAFKIRGAANAVAMLDADARSKGVWTISAGKALAPHVRVLGAEPETAAPGAKSFAAHSPQVFDEWQASFVVGAGGKSIFPRMWERISAVVDGSIVVTLNEVKSAIRLVASKTRVIAEGAGALGVAAALKEKEGPVVAVVSGGNIDLKKFCEIIG